MTTVPLDQSKKRSLVIGGKKYRAHVFIPAGKEIELYSVQALARALHRNPHTLYVWERQGLLPKPLFVVTGTPLQEMRRWYSREQIVNLWQVWNRFPYANGRSQFKAAFFTALKMVFDEGEIIDVGSLKVRPTAAIKAITSSAVTGTVSAARQHPPLGYQRVASTSPTIDSTASHRAGATPTQPQSGRSGALAETASRSSGSFGDDIERRGHRAQPSSEPTQRMPRHAERAPSGVGTKGTDYRRRPSKSV